MNKFSTWLWRTAFWLRYKVGYGLKVYGRDNFPMEGPVIVVPNHLSNNDPPICGVCITKTCALYGKAGVICKSYFSIFLYLAWCVSSKSWSY